MKTAVLVFLLGMLSQDIPQHDLTLKEVISILADYDVRHETQQPTAPPAFGVTVFESSPPQMFIFNTGDTVSKRQTVIHELIHVHYRQLGMNPPEEFVNQEEVRLYKQIFLEAKP